MSQSPPPSLARDFRELRVYRTAFEVAMALYERSKAWPPEERFALTDQVRRSSRAVCAAIAEAWFKRRYPRHFVSKLSEAASEAAETLVWIDFAVACGQLSAEEAEILGEQVRRVTGGLVRMMAEPDRWCGPSASLREPDTPYDASQED
jgi:four helix bundle protein